MAKYLYHARGCGEKAMEYLHDVGPYIGQALVACEWRKLNGEYCEPDDRIICGSCGKKMEGMRVEDVR